MKATEKQKERMKQYQERDDIKEKRKKYMHDYNKKRMLNEEQIKKESERKRNYYINNKEKVLSRNKKWMNNNDEKFKEYLKRYYEEPNHIEKRKENSKKWQEKIGKKEYLKKKRIWENDKRNNDLNFRMKKNLRIRVLQAFQKYSKTGKIRKSKDYNIDYDKIIRKLVLEIPEDFNKKTYQMDHIKPCCAFDLTNQKEIEECFSPDNYQWLTMEDNKIKIKSDLKQRK